MMPFWDVRLVVRQLTAMIPPPKTGTLRSGRSPSHRAEPGLRCRGCSRRAFVRIELPRPGEIVPCPICGRFLGFVKPLDADVPPLEYPV
jgi:hypothetical protein